MLKITRCPSCGSGQIRKVRRSWTGRFRSRRYIVPNLEFYECPKCGEKVYGREAMQKIQFYSPAYRKPRLVRRSA
jgi:YgiT-type zinc finger domain-containing protein